MDASSVVAPIAIMLRSSTLSAVLLWPLILALLAGVLLLARLVCVRRRRGRLRVFWKR